MRKLDGNIIQREHAMKWLDNCLNLVRMSAYAPAQKGLSSEQVYMLLEAV